MSKFSPHSALLSLHTRFTTVLQQAISFAHSSSLHSSSHLSETALDTQRTALADLETEIEQWERLIAYTLAVEDEAIAVQVRGDRGKAEIRPNDFQHLSRLIAEAQNRVMALLRRREGGVEGQVWEVFMTLVQRLYSAFFSVSKEKRSREGEAEGELPLSDTDSSYSLRGDSQRQLRSSLPLTRQNVALKEPKRRLQTLEEEKERLSSLMHDLESALSESRAEAEALTKALASTQASLQQLTSQRALEQEHMAELKRENSLLSEALQALKDTQESLGQAEEQSQRLGKTLEEELKARQALESRLRLSEQHCTELLERYREGGRDQRIASLSEQLKKLNTKYEQVSTELADRLEEISQLHIEADTYKRQAEMAGTLLSEAEATKQQVAVVCELVGVERCQAVPMALAHLQQALKAQDEQASDLLQALEAAELGAVALVQERSALVQQLQESRLARAAADDLVEYLRQDNNEKDAQVTHLSTMLTQRLTNVEAKDKLCRQLEAELQITESLYADLESENVQITEELWPQLKALQPGLESAAINVYRAIVTRLKSVEARLQDLVLRAGTKVTSRRALLSAVGVLIHTQEAALQHCLKAICTKLESLRAKTDTFCSGSVLKLAQSNRLLKAQLDRQTESVSRLQAQAITHKAVQRQSVSSFVTDVQSSLRTKQKALVQRLQTLESRLSTGGQTTSKARKQAIFESAETSSPAETSASPLSLSLGGRTSPLPSKSWLL